MRVGSLSVAIAGCVALALGCTDNQPVGPNAPAMRKATPGVAQVIEGETGPGSLYELFLPASWNGDLVIYSHGYVGPNEPIALPQVDPLPQILTGLGFGVAFSSSIRRVSRSMTVLVSTRRNVLAKRSSAPVEPIIVSSRERASSSRSASWSSTKV